MLFYAVLFIEMCSFYFWNGSKNTWTVIEFLWMTHTPAANCFRSTLFTFFNQKRQPDPFSCMHSVCVCAFFYIYIYIVCTISLLASPQCSIFIFKQFPYVKYNHTNFNAGGLLSAWMLSNVNKWNWFYVAKNLFGTRDVCMVWRRIFFSVHFEHTGCFLKFN